ncbi:hypothetical protein CROQUDRAFT_131883 [Cronartium quercuum f. sp. fusiforme G11]|uniref:Uncharacterized protein n=1 Tax=Cronartium quercuum f. sp. fusiforme G11 TaxID=708437 RepID=A0A9P6NMY8_9BASI|nr:hypothetical protein CROQUDRAFT_131883 [Cronartium quercuum f. sp. fusiforme G11]
MSLRTSPHVRLKMTQCGHWLKLCHVYVSLWLYTFGVVAFLSERTVYIGVNVYFANRSMDSAFDLTYPPLITTQPGDSFAHDLWHFLAICDYTPVLAFEPLPNTYAAIHVVLYSWSKSPDQWDILYLTEEEKTWQDQAILDAEGSQKQALVQARVSLFQTFQVPA